MQFLARLKNSSLLRDTKHLSIGQGLRLLIQAAYFVLIARSLGPDAFGAFVAVVAMAAIVSPFSGLGTPNLFIKNVRSGKRDAETCWGNGILLTVISGTVLSVLLIAFNLLFKLKTGLFAVVIVAISDLVLMKITELAAFGFAASNRMKDTATQMVVISLCRLAGIAVLWAVLHTVSLNQWVLMYLLTSIVGTGYSLTKGAGLWGRPKIDLGALKEDISEGVFFSISTSASTVYNDVDKIMLSKLSDNVSTGIYGAAYRIIDVSLTPVRSLVSAAYPNFFSKGVGGLRATYPYAKTLISKSAIYGAAVFVGLWVFAPVVPHVLGKQYESAIPALRWLALIPFLRCFHLLLADSLSGAGFQRTRTGIQIIVGFVNVILNILILPRYSWKGAAWTSLACDGMLVAILWLTVVYLLRRERTAAIAPVQMAELR